MKINNLFQILFLLLFLADCAGTAKKTAKKPLKPIQKKIQKKSSSGWIDENTLVVQGFSKTRPGIEGIIRKMIRALDLAKIDARNKAIEIVMGLPHYEYEKKLYERYPHLYMKQYFLPFLDGGLYFNGQFDSDGKCSIFFKLQKKGLKLFSSQSADKKISDLNLK